MFALVQFLVDKVKAVVPVSDIKNFNSSLENDLLKPYEVFWKSPNGEGTGYWYAVVLLVAETEELIEQRKKRVKLPTQKALEDLLDDKKCTSNEESRRKNKEIQDKRFICEKEKFKEILTKKLKESKVRTSESPFSGEDKLNLKSVRKDEESIKIQHKLKLKQQENILLRKRNDELQDLNIKLQKQLLLLLNANNNLEDNKKKTIEHPVSGNEEETNLTCNEREAQSTTNFAILRDTSEEIECSIVQGEKAQSSAMLSDTLEEDGCSSVQGEIKLPFEPTPSCLQPLNCSIISDSLYVKDNGNLLKWKDEQMELAPSVYITKDLWLKVLESKNINESRLAKNLAVSLWGSDTLLNRSVTGAPCK